MPKKRPKLIILAQHIAGARRTVADQRALLAKLQATGQPTSEAEGTLRTYISALQDLEAHARKMREEAEAKKGETLKKKKAPTCRSTGALVLRSRPVGTAIV
jgi:hypothetical protein